MSDSTEDLIAYWEQRRQRRNRIAAIVAAVVAVVALVATVTAIQVGNANRREQERNEVVEDYACLMSGNRDCD